MLLTHAQELLDPSVPDYLPRDMLAWMMTTLLFYGKMGGAKQLLVLLQEYLSGIGENNQVMNALKFNFVLCICRLLQCS